MGATGLSNTSPAAPRTGPARHQPLGPVGSACGHHRHDHRHHDGRHCADDHHGDTRSLHPALKCSIIFADDHPTQSCPRLKHPKTCLKPPWQTFTVTFTAIFTAVTTAVAVVLHFGICECEHSVTAVNVTVNACWGFFGQVSGCLKRGQLQVGWLSARIMEHFSAGCNDCVTLCYTFCNMCYASNR